MIAEGDVDVFGFHVEVEAVIAAIATDPAARYLARREARGLRYEFNQLARLEAHYRRNGLSRWERQDLDRRFDILEARIRYERRDRDDRRGRGYR